MNTFESHLCAKLFRISNPLRNFSPDFSKIRFIRNFNRLPVKGKPLVLFAGCFIVGEGTVTLPFSMALSIRNGTPASSLAQFSYFDARIESRITAFLSVLDFLEATGDVPNGARVQHMERLLSNRPGARKAVVDDYPAFCERAAKDLPYDLSLEVLCGLAA